MITKGVIMAGGNGSRLAPLTMTQNKHFLSVYDKPMIFYSLSTLMLMGIEHVVIVTQSKWIDSFKKIIVPEDLGLIVEYHVQDEPTGIGNIFSSLKKTSEVEQYVLILGDNFLYGNNLPNILKNAITSNRGATIFTYPVKDPTRFGIVHNIDGRLELVEKPTHPQNDAAVIGLYIFSTNVHDLSTDLSKSSRGEYEITDLLNIYAHHNLLDINRLGQGNAWIDLGTFSSLSDATTLVKVVQDRQGLLLGSPHSIALRKNPNNKKLISKIFNEQSEYFTLLQRTLNE